MSDQVRSHYELHPYPHYPLVASLRRCDTYAHNLTALWTRFNGSLPPPDRRILLAGCGSFSPYPFALANPCTPITALDLSAASLRRALWHCRLHGLGRVTFQCGDLLDPAMARGTFGLIDAYGVLHHLDDPLAGLKALAARLETGGVLRLMLYSRYARRAEEAIRRAFRLLKVTDLSAARHLLGNARPGSRLRRFAEGSDEMMHDSGLADALLHPRVHTMRIDEVVEMVLQSGLELLQFAHEGALADPDKELERVRRLERAREAPGNFVLYLGRNVAGHCGTRSGSLIMLNPCLSRAVSPFALGTVRIAPRLGTPNPPLGWQERRFLRRFRHPRAWDRLPDQDRAMTGPFRDALFLLQYA
jgi:SAM-dependent methyltransferase